jgi:hypothetical protein
MAEKPDGKLTTFVDTLTELRRGKAVLDLTQVLSELVTAVREAGAGGKLILTLTVKPASSGDGNALILADSIVIKPPKLPTPVTILFANDDGKLSRNDPRQPELSGLRTPATVSNLREAPREVGGES